MASSPLYSEAAESASDLKEHQPPCRGRVALGSGGHVGMVTGACQGRLPSVQGCHRPRPLLSAPAVYLEVCVGFAAPGHLGRWNQQQMERPLVPTTPAHQEWGGDLGKIGRPQSKTDLLQISPRASKNF